ncbi:MAG: galactokinase [Sphaerochaetaceae bacterium]
MKQLAELHRSEYEQTPAIVVRVPGVYTLLGEFADFCMGHTLCGASSSMLQVAISARSDQSARLFIAPLKDRKRFSLQTLKYRREDRWANFVKGVVSVLSNRGFSVTGFNMTFSGDLLEQEGAMVSSALTLGSAIAIRTLFHPQLTLEDCAAIGYSALFSFASVPCRLVIFLAMIYVTPRHLLLFDVNQLSSERIAYDSTQKEALFLIVESHISPHALQEELASRKNESKAAFEKLKKNFPNRIIRELGDQEIKEVPSRLLSEEEKRICLYVLSESRQAKEAARLLAQKEMVLYGKTLSKVQSGLRDALEVTCPEIDWLSKRALEINGSLGAVMITTGFSGSLLVLLAPDAIDVYTARIEEYEHIFGFRPSWRQYVPSGPLTIEIENS